MTRMLIGMAAGLALAAIIYVVALQDQAGARQGVPANEVLDIPEAFAGEIIVRQGPAELTNGELESVINTIPEDDRAPFLRSPERLDKMLGDLLVVRLMAADGLQDGLLDSQLVAGGLRQAIASYLGEEQGKRIRNQAEADVEDYAALAREKYQARPEDHRLPEKASFTQLYLADQEGRDEDALIAEIHENLLEGDDFEALIRDYSDETDTGQDVVRYEGVRLTELDDAFAAQLRELDSEGDVSMPFETQFGWHIVRLDSYQAPRQQSFEEVVEKLERQARNEVRNRALRRYLNQLIADHAPEVDSRALERVLERYGVEAPADVSVDQGSSVNE